MERARHTVLIADLVLAPLAGLLTGYDYLRLWDYPDPAALPAAGRGIEAVVCAGATCIDAALIDALPQLKIIACVAVGYDGVDVAHARARGVVVTHAPWLNADDVADQAIGLMIGAYRQMLKGHQMVLDGRWQAGERLSGFGSLTGKAVGIVGLGHIGVEIARRAEAMKMQVCWWGPRERPAPWPRADSLMALAQASDVLMITARADDANQGLINRDVIEAVGPKGMIVNMARGRLVDEDALIAALRDGQLGGAGLDVFVVEPASPERWADVPNIFLTPHSAGASDETVAAMVGQAAENMRRVLAGEPPLSPVPG